MKRKNQIIISIVIVLALLALFLFYLKHHTNRLKELSLASPKLLIVLFFFYILDYFITSMITIIAFKSTTIKIGLFESFQLILTKNFYNLITPFKGGLAAKALYLNQKHKVDYTTFLSCISAAGLISFTVSTLIGLTALIYIFINHKIFNWPIFIVFLLIFIALFLILIFAPKIRELKYKWVNHLIRILNGWRNLTKNIKYVIAITFISIIQLTLLALMLHLQFHVFDLKISFIKCLFLVCVTDLSLLIAITPSGLGIQEATTAFAAISIGITPDQSLPALILGRAVSLTILLVLGPIFSYFLMKDIKKQPK